MVVLEVNVYVYIVFRLLIYYCQVSIFVVNVTLEFNGNVDFLFPYLAIFLIWPSILYLDFLGFCILDFNSFGYWFENGRQY